MHAQHKSHEDSETCLKIGGNGNSTATTQRTDARRLGCFCTVGIWNINVPWRKVGVHVGTGATRDVSGWQLIHTY